MSVVELSHVSFRYSEAGDWILKDCSFSLEAGEFLLLSGPSGEGKSTLLNLINGIIPHAVAGQVEGEIRICGQSVSGVAMSKRARLVGSVLQNADSQIVSTQVDDEVAFGCENFKVEPAEIHRRVQQACGQMKLEPQWATATLSGGQKQRLITASTLAMGQKVLVFDEPLANLDTAGAHLLLQTLRRMADEEGYAVLFVEHRLDMALPYAHRAAWLEGGRLEVFSDKQQALGRNLHRIEDTGQTPPCPEVCLRAEHLQWGAAGRQILKDISFSLHRGERLVILGENGCGKTTLLRLLAHLQKPGGGTITAHLSSPVRPGSPKWFQKVGFVYQNPVYQMFLSSVADEVAYNAASPEAAREQMERFHLTPMAQRHPHSLSEGQKRRVSIAAITAGEPEILLLDEPTVGQDYQNLQMIVQMLSQLHRARGTAMVTVTHDIRCAAALADRVLWIQDGVIHRAGGKELIDEYFTSAHAAPREASYV